MRAGEAWATERGGVGMGEGASVSWAREAAHGRAESAVAPQPAPSIYTAAPPAHVTSAGAQGVYACLWRRWCAWGWEGGICTTPQRFAAPARRSKPLTCLPCPPRAAALCRRLYIRPGMGIGHFKHVFGGRERRRGCKPEHHALAACECQSRLMLGGNAGDSAASRAASGDTSPSTTRLLPVSRWIRYCNPPRLK